MPVQEVVPTSRWKAKIQGVSVVLRGSFNPAIFHPSWFVSRNLIGETEAANAADLIVTREISAFALDWARVQVTQDRFAASSIDPSMFPTLRDLVWGAFSTLEHTPLTQLGLNTEAHFEMDNEEQWHALGDMLAPKGPWQELFPSRVGMRTVTLESKRADCEATYLRATVQPSVKVQPGVYFQLNEHYDVTPSASGPPRRLVDTLKDNWDSALAFSRTLQVHILNQVDHAPKRS